MTRIEDSVVDVKRLFRHWEISEAESVTVMLVDLMHFCDHTRGVSWARCIEAAQKQHQKEVREAADATPLPTK